MTLDLAEQENKQTEKFLVDDTLPQTLFGQICRLSAVSAHWRGYLME